MALTIVYAPHLGHLNSISVAWPLARSLPQWRHLISLRLSVCMARYMVAPRTISAYSVPSRSRHKQAETLHDVDASCGAVVRCVPAAPVGARERPRHCQILKVPMRLSKSPIRQSRCQKIPSALDPNTESYPGMRPGFAQRSAARQSYLYSCCSRQS